MADTKEPKIGQNVIQYLVSNTKLTNQQIKSLAIQGDLGGTSIIHSQDGTVVHRKNISLYPQVYNEKEPKYFFGTGIYTEPFKVKDNDSGTAQKIVNKMFGNLPPQDYPKVIHVALLGDDQYIDVEPLTAVYEEYGYTPWKIKYIGPTPSGGGGGGSGYIYTGDGDLGSGHIFVDYSYTNPVICSNLRYIDDLLNYPISGDAIGSELHFAQIRDIKDGAGTQVDYHWNSIGDSTQEGGQLIKFIDGVCVNLNVSGGTYITTKFHQGVGYGDYTSASIDCNLSGTYNWYPHTSGFIAIVPQTDANQNITGGIISTNLHAGSGIAIDPQTGEITCTIEGGGGSGENTYYADESTIKLSSTNNTFYLYDVEPALTGEGDIKIGNYGFDGLRRITTISATPYTGGDNISVDNYVISMTATIPTKTSDLTNDSHFITINDVPPGSVYYGDNVTIAASGTNNNIFYVIDGVFAPLTTVVNLSTELSGHIDYVSSNIPLSTSELVNDVPFVTSTDLDAYYKVSAFNAVGDHLQYVPRLGRLNCTLTGGDWIQIDSNDQINCTLTNVSDLNNDAGYITTVDIPPSTTYIGTSGIAIEAILDENQQPTTSSFIGLSSQFYNDLTAISTRPATGDKILSSHNGTLSWQTNNASSPTWTSLTPSLLAVDNNNHTLSAATQSGGGGGGGLNIVYITTQDQRVVVPNTKYCVTPIASLSTNVIDFPDMNPTAISSFETDNNERIYKYFFHGFQSRPDYLYETTSARIDGDVKYGAYDPKNNNWYNYMDGDSHFGNIFIFEPQQQDCVVEIDCGIGGNSLAIAPSGLVWSTFSDDVISGTPQSWYEAWRTDTWPPQKDAGFLQNWRIELVRGNQYMFIYDHNTNMWNMINT